MAYAREFDAAARRRRRARRKARLYAVLAGVAACILLVSWGITAVINAVAGAKAPPASSAPHAVVGTEMLAPLPMQGGAAAVTAQFGPVQQTGSYTVVKKDASVIRQPACGQVDLEYFADAAFLGDSLTEGFTEYKINLSGALICGYVGTSPSGIVNRTTLKHPERGQEIALDVLANAQPQKLYLLLGTNALTTTGGDDQFINYYSVMLDQLRQTLGEDCVIYVQSVPPVRPEAVESRPGLASERLRAINERLAALAEEKGCCYLDLWETLADADGWLKAELAESDGVHLKSGKGYTAWVNYLRTHTRYAANSPWTPGSAYAS